MWKYRFAGSVAALLLVLHALAVQSTQFQSAGEKSVMEDDSGPLVGGIHDSPEGHENDLHIIDLARFAVDQHNSKANTLLEFEKIVKVRQQVVAGMLYYFTIEVKEGEAKKLYEAKVAERQWENVKELIEFKPAEGGANA